MLIDFEAALPFKLAVVLAASRLVEAEPVVVADSPPTFPAVPLVPAPAEPTLV